MPLEFVVPAGANQMKNYPPGTGFSELPLKLRREASESDAHQLSNRLNNQLDPVFIVAFILMDSKSMGGSDKKSAVERSGKRGEGRRTMLSRAHVDNAVFSGTAKK